MTEFQQWNETTLNLLQAISEYVPLESKPTVWKLVYDPHTEKPVELTTGAVDEQNKWIEISAQQAAENPQHDPRVRIQNGTIIRICLSSNDNIATSVGLGVYQHQSGKYATSDYNMLIIDPQSPRRWKIGRIS